MKNQSQFLISLVLTIIIITALLTYFDTKKIIEIISKMDLGYLLLAIVAYILVNFVMAKRIETLLREMGQQEITLKDTLKANFGGMLASDFTPARSGYFLTAFILSSQKKIDLDKTLISIFGPQLLEFTIKVISTFIMIIFIINKTQNSGSWMLYAFITLAFISGIIAFFASTLFIRGLLERFSFTKKIPGLKKIYYLFWLMRENSKVILHRWKEVLGYTLAGWFFKGLEWYFIARALNFNFFDPILDLLFILIFQPFITITHFLPLPTIAGTGASEVAGATVFVLLGIAIEKSIAFTLMTRFLMIVVDLIGLYTILPLLMKEKFTGVLEDIENIEKRCKVNDSGF